MTPEVNLSKSFENYCQNRFLVTISVTCFGDIVSLKHLLFTLATLRFHNDRDRPKLPGTLLLTPRKAQTRHDNAEHSTFMEDLMGGSSTPAKTYLRLINQYGTSGARAVSTQRQPIARTALSTPASTGGEYIVQTSVRSAGRRHRRAPAATAEPTSAPPSTPLSGARKQ